MYNGEPNMKKTKMAIAAGLLLSAAGMAMLPAGADTIPFWGDADPATNRTSASSQTATLASEFESRLCTEADFSLATFNSRPVGAIFMIR